MENLICIPASGKDKARACKVVRVGKLHKAKRAVKVADIRENLEVKFMSMAKLAALRPSDIDRAIRAENQRNARKSKR